MLSVLDGKCDVNIRFRVFRMKFFRNDPCKIGNGGDRGRKEG